MAEEEKVITITVDGPRGSGVTRTVSFIAIVLGAAEFMIGGKPIKYKILDMGKERDGNG